MRHAIYLCTADGSYRDLERTFEAPDARTAAQQAFDLLDLHLDEEFPELLVVPDDHVQVFTRDDSGKAVTTTEDLPRSIARGPRFTIVRFDLMELGEQQS